MLRVSVGIHLDDLESVLETYDLMSKKFFTQQHQHYLMRNTKPQMSSCFLLAMQDDSIDDDIRHVETNGKISQSAGGVGLSTQCSCNGIEAAQRKKTH
jgi:ribonucleoside-diphosphate reductase alpha chain